MCSKYDIWETIVRSIPQPPIEKCVWTTQPSPHLAIILIETRCHQLLAGVLYNMAHMYGGQPDVSLYIFHGTQNLEYIKAIIDTWSGVHLINLNVHEYDLIMYNDTLTDIKFWNQIPSNYTLIIQTDTLILKPIDNLYFQYDFVGAPWTQAWASGHKYVGNGGFSLRKTSTMRKICYVESLRTSGHRHDNKQEDVFLSGKICSDKVAPVDIAKQFSVESIYYPSPCGLHKPYEYVTMSELIHLLQQVPHLPTDVVAYLKGTKPPLRPP